MFTGEFYGLDLEVYTMVLPMSQSQESSESRALPTSNWLGNSAQQNIAEEKGIKCTIISAMILLCEENLSYYIEYIHRSTQHILRKSQTFTAVS